MSHGKSESRKPAGINTSAAPLLAGKRSPASALLNAPERQILVGRPCLAAGMTYGAGRLAEGFYRRWPPVSRTPAGWSQKC